MIHLKIHQSPYYNNKKDFVKLYKKLKLAWKEGKDIDGKLVNGWFFADRIDEYVLKLSEEGEFKRFEIKGCQSMVNFLKSIGAVEFNIEEKEKEEKGVSVDNISGKTQDIQKITQEERFGHFIGADLLSGYRTCEILKDMPDNWGVIWNEKDEKTKNTKTKS